MRHERPQLPPPSNDPKDQLMGRLIDNVYWLKHRVDRLERFCLILSGVLLGLVAAYLLTKWVGAA